MALLTFPLNVIPGDFTKALVAAETAHKLMGKEGDPIGMSQLREAVKQLAESNKLLINILTDHQIK